MFARVSRCVRSQSRRGESTRQGAIKPPLPPARPAFRQHEAYAEGNDIPPIQERRKNAKRECLITSPNRAPAETQRSGFGGKRTSDRESKSCRLRRDEGFVVRSDDGQHRICLVCGKAAALPNAPGGAWPHTPFSGRSPHPLKAPPVLRGDERNHFRKVIDYEKRYQIQHTHGVRRP